MIDAAVSELGLDPELGGLAIVVEVKPDGQMDVRMQDAQGGVVFARTLAASAACVERARSAAIVAHSYMATKSIPSKAGGLDAVAAPPLAPKAAPVIVESASPPPPWGVTIGLGLLTFAAPQADRLNPALGGSLAVAIRPSRSWGIVGRTLFLGRRVLPLTETNGGVGTVEAAWQRLALGVGPTFVSSLKLGDSVDVFGGVQGLFAFTTVSGRGLITNRDDSAWVPGVMATAGFDVPLYAPIRTALEAGMIFWASSDRLTLGGADTGQGLPRLEALVMLTVELESRRSRP